jgi:hypothetical protein
MEASSILSGNVEERTTDKSVPRQSFKIGLIRKLRSLPLAVLIGRDFHLLSETQRYRQQVHTKI